MEPRAASLVWYHTIPYHSNLEVRVFNAVIAEDFGTSHQPTLAPSVVQTALLVAQNQGCLLLDSLPPTPWCCDLRKRSSSSASKERDNIEPCRWWSPI